MWWVKSLRLICQSKGKCNLGRNTKLVFGCNLCLMSKPCYFWQKFQVGPCFLPWRCRCRNATNVHENFVRPSTIEDIYACTIVWKSLIRFSYSLMNRGLYLFYLLMVYFILILPFWKISISHHLELCHTGYWNLLLLWLSQVLNLIISLVVMILCHIGISISCFLIKYVSCFVDLNFFVWLFLFIMPNVVYIL